MRISPHHQSRPSSAGSTSPRGNATVTGVPQPTATSGTTPAVNIAPRGRQARRIVQTRNGVSHGASIMLPQEPRLTLPDLSAEMQAHILRELPTGEIPKVALSARYFSQPALHHSLATVDPLGEQLLPTLDPRHLTPRSRQAGAASREAERDLRTIAGNIRAVARREISPVKARHHATMHDLGKNPGSIGFLVAAAAKDPYSARLAIAHWGRLRTANEFGSTSADERAAVDAQLRDAVAEDLRQAWDIRTPSSMSVATRRDLLAQLALRQETRANVESMSYEELSRELSPRTESTSASDHAAHYTTLAMQECHTGEHSSGYGFDPLITRRIAELPNEYDRLSALTQMRDTPLHLVGEARIRHRALCAFEKDLALLQAVPSISSPEDRVKFFSSLIPQRLSTSPTTSLIEHFSQIYRELPASHDKAAACLAICHALPSTASIRTLENYRGELQKVREAIDPQALDAHEQHRAIDAAAVHIAALLARKHSWEMNAPQAP